MVSEAIHIPKRGLLQFFILKLIQDQSRYGYEILNECQERFVDTTEIKSGTIYTMLKRLEKNELLSSSWEKNKTGPIKKIYTITPNGTESLISGLEILSKRKIIFDELVRFYEQFQKTHQ